MRQREARVGQHVAPAHDSVPSLLDRWATGYGGVRRGEFETMTGLGDRTAVSALSALVRRGLLVSDTPQGKVRFGLPRHALRFYFPALWPEADTAG